MSQDGKQRYGHVLCNVTAPLCMHRLKANKRLMGMCDLAESVFNVANTGWGGGPLFSLPPYLAVSDAVSIIERCFTRQGQSGMAW